MKKNLAVCCIILGIWMVSPIHLPAQEKTTVVQTDSLKIDPNCKMKVKPTTKHKSTYQKQEYFFCAEGCNLKFEKDPLKYIKK